MSDDPTMEVQKLIDEAVAQNSAQYERRMADLKPFVDIGTKVYQELRRKGSGMNLLPGTDFDAVAKVCARYAAMGKDFDTLMTAVKADVMLSSEWERFAMMLRMAQED